jgi:hypothetical protein
MKKRDSKISLDCPYKGRIPPSAPEPRIFVNIRKDNFLQKKFFVKVGKYSRVPSVLC